MDLIQPYLEANIDFKGQKLAESYYTLILSVGAILSFIIGFIKQDLKITFYSFGFFILLTLIVVLPPYKIYKKNPITWLPRKQTTTTTIEL